MPALLEIKQLSKRYGATKALDSLDLRVDAGEVHALLGHNGAGKSTLIKCLGGAVRPSSGDIVLAGEQLIALSPGSSINAGISIIYQELGLIDTLTVAENIFLGSELHVGPFVSSSRQRHLARSVLAEIDSGIDPDLPVTALSSGERQTVAIAKSLHRDAKLLVLDEPTAALSPVEAAALGRVIERLRARGIGIIYVTHLLDEVMAFADRVTVLRNGQAVWRAEVAAINKPELVAAISDRAFEVSRDDHQVDRSSPPILALRGGQTGHLGLDVFVGETIALYGLVGSGRTRLLETLYGLRPASDLRVTVDGTVRRVDRPNDALRLGVALVPGDRARQGLFASLSAQENVLMNALRRFARLFFRSGRRERGAFDAVAESFELRPHNPRLPASQFSGGNQQKLLLGRWVNDFSGVKVLLVDDPTQGVDVGARADIYEVLRRTAREHGVAVVFASNEPEEVMALSDRVVIMIDGVCAEVFDTADVDAGALLERIHPTQLAHEQAEGQSDERIEEKR